MSSRRRLILLGAGVALLHFLVTWFLVLQSWSDDGAARVVRVISFPGHLALGYVGGDHEKLQNAVLMLANSALWSLGFIALVALARWGIRLKRGLGG
jgi:hypothetical protein